jgi:hypothetical protein
MNRDEANQALDILSKVVGQARDDTAVENWGVIWVLHGVLNCVGYMTTNALLLRGYLTPWPYVALWVVINLFNLVTSFLLKGQRSGVRSFVETQIWTIWTTYMAAMALLAILNYQLGLDRLFMGPVAAVLSAMAFAAMGSTAGRVWFIPAVIFALSSFVIAHFYSIQLYLFGALWTATQITGGLLLHRSKVRRAQSGQPLPTLV